MEAPDFTWSANGKNVDIMFYFSPYPGTDRQFLNVQINGLFGSHGGLAFSLQPALDDLYNPYHWVGLYWDQNDNLLTNATLDITDLGSTSSPVPEPSSILLFGTGILGVAAQTRRKTSRTKNLDKVSTRNVGAGDSHREFPISRRSDRREGENSSNARAVS
jgi:hypothetical protein